jgi:hypothetical protein
MVSRMATFYGPQAAQVNKKPVSELFLDLMLMQHPCDENLELREMCTRLEVDPFELGTIAFFRTFTPR